jgi:phosphate uptake regulator
MFKDIVKLLRRDSLLSQALQECYEMLDLCRLMVHGAVESLRRHDTAYAGLDVRQLDKKINSFERDVRRKVLTHLALGNKADTASGLALVSIVIDIERIGDYSKNIVDLARVHPGRLDVAEHEQALTAIEQASIGLFDQAVVTFKSGDVEQARRVMHNYKSDVAKKCREVEEQLVAGRTSLSAADAVTLALYGRFLKRISAHSKNLVSSIVNPVDRIGYSE